MANYLSCFWQILLWSIGPLLLCGVAVYVCRTLFTYLSGEERLSRGVLTLALAPSTPIRVLGSAAMAWLFGHKIHAIRFLDLHDAEGELGYVENSYHPLNPVALLGKLFYAVVPAALTLAVVFLVLLACFGQALPDFMRAAIKLAHEGGAFYEYPALVGDFLRALFVADGWWLVLRLLGAALILLLCMGAFVSVFDLLGCFIGTGIYVFLTALFTLALMLFDARAERLFMASLHAYAAVFVGVYAVVLIAAVLLLLGAAIAFFVRLFLERHAEGGRVVFDGDAAQKPKKPRAARSERKQAAPKKDAARRPVKRVHPDGFTVYEYEVGEDEVIDLTDVPQSEENKEEQEQTAQQE